MIYIEDAKLPPYRYDVYQLTAVQYAQMRILESDEGCIFWG